MENVENIAPPKILSWLISGAFFMQMVDGTILNTALPEMAIYFGEPPLDMQAVVVAYMLTVAFLLPLSGWLADKFGAKSVFLSAMVIFTLGSALCAMSSVLHELVLARIVQGIGGALMVPVGRLIVLRVYPKKDFVKVLSFVLLPASLGPIMGPPLGGFISEYLSWQWIFLINLPIGALLVWQAFIKMPYIEKEEIERFDWSGFLLLSISIVLIILSANHTKVADFGAICRFVMVGLAALGLGCFLFHINRSKRPLFHPALLKVASFRIGLMGNMFSRMGMGSMPLLIPLLLQLGLGFSPSKSGMFVLIMGLFSIVGRFGVSTMISKFGFRFVLVFNTILVGATMASLALVSEDTTYHYFILLPLAVMGMLNSVQFTAMNSLTLIDLPKKLSGEGNSLLSVVMQVCVTLGISLGASLLEWLEVSPNIEVISAFQYTFLAIGVLTIVSSLSFMFTPKDAGK